MHLSRLRCNTLLLFVFVSFLTQAQVTVSGCITDAADKSPLEHVSVVLYKFNSNQIITYSFSNQDGCFKLPGVPQGVFTVKANMLGYHPFSQELVIAADSVNVPLTINLKPKTTELENIEIRGIQPIIVKQDTIIYNIGHWTQATDRTLEEVLARIPGFKIRGDGELSVNGKPVDKVIIDGKEVSDGGAALITRSISPENIKEIQLRLDEQDAALKESLIDTRKLVVLDIRLRDDVNKSFFGLARTSMGHQKTTQPGAYGNVFSLRKKTNLHLFAEHDQFGEQTISLDQIKNIGQEAFQKIFDLPADFNEISEKQDFNREIYGFKDYTRSINNVLGATGHHRFNERIQLFIGSYNSYQLLGRKRSYEQRFFDGPETGFDEISSLKNFSSKNKVELRFDHSKIKARADLNAVIINDRNADNNRSLNEVAYQFDDKLNAVNLYQNGVFEYLPGGSWAFRVKTALAQRATNHIKTLQHNDSNYGQFIVNQALQPVLSLQQTIKNQHTSWHNEAGMFLKKSWGQTSLQFRHELQRLEAEKQAIDQAEEAPIANVPDFNLPVTNRQFQKFGPGLRQSLKLGQVQLAGEFYYTTSTFPLQNGTRQSRSLPEYKLSFDYNRNMDHILLSWTKRISAFSLHKIMAGFTLLNDFQNVSVIGPVSLTPQHEEVLEIWTGKYFSSINLMVDPTLLMGRIRTGDQIVVGSLPAISLYNQLETGYVAASLALTKTFVRIPLQLVLEPELINSFQENIDQDVKRYVTKTMRQLVGIKVTSDFEKKTIHFLIYPKYTAFRFSSELDPVPSTQRMASLECHVGWSVIKQLSISTTWRHVVFSGTSESHFTNGGLQIRYSRKKIVAWLETDNILNNSLFVRQTISPNVFVDNSEAVFSRYLKVGVDIKFR
jgi:hypothetical protein